MAILATQEDLTMPEMAVLDNLQVTILAVEIIQFRDNQAEEIMVSRVEVTMVSQAAVIILETDKTDDLHIMAEEEIIKTDSLLVQMQVTREQEIPDNQAGVIMVSRVRVTMEEEVMAQILLSQARSQEQLILQREDLRVIPREEEMTRDSVLLSVAGKV